MDTNTRSVRALLQGRKQYLIPSYQRKYKWGDQELFQLWDDIVILWKEDPDGVRKLKHFLGPVFIGSIAPVDPEPVERHLLVDGQQRYTTLVLILAAIRDSIKNGYGRGVDITCDSIDELLTNPRAIEGKFKLDLKDDPQSELGDRNVLRQIVSTGSSEALSKDNTLVKAYHFFKAKIRRTDSPTTDWLFKNVLDKLYVSLHELEPEDKPQEIFESLNAKGKHLSAYDLFRLCVFHHIDPNKVEDVYQKEWRTIESNLHKGDPSENGLDKFAHIFLRSQDEFRAVDSGEVLNNEDELKSNKDPQVIYRYTKKLLKASSNDFTCSHFIDNLKKTSQWYPKLIKPETEEHNPRLREGLERLLKVNGQVSHYFVIMAYKALAEGQLKNGEDDLVEILNILENFFVRRFVCDIQGAGLYMQFPTLYRSILKRGMTLPQGLRHILLNDETKTYLYPSDEEFLKNLKEGRVYRKKTTPLFFILESLEQSFGHKELPDTTNNKITIEHILPQKPTTWWNQQIGGRNLHKKWCDTLGNLTLFASKYNELASNMSFPEKCPIYARSNFEITRRICEDFDTWGIREIQIRADVLAERALQLWSHLEKTEAPESNVSAPGAPAIRPVSVRVRHDQREVNTWKAVLPTFYRIARDLGYDLDHIMHNSGGKLISRYDHEISNMKEPEKLEGTAYSYDVNPSLQDRKLRVVYTLEQAAGHLGLRESDWSLKTTERGSELTAIQELEQQMTFEES